MVRKMAKHLTYISEKSHSKTNFLQSDETRLESTSHMAYMEERLRYIQKMKKGWDGEDAKPATKNTIDQTFRFLKWVEKKGFLEYISGFGLDTDGSIVLDWNIGRDDSFEGSLTIYGDGTCSYSIQVGDESFVEDEASINENIDSKLADLLGCKGDLRLVQENIGR